jgi:hypothetical protein
MAPASAERNCLMNKYNVDSVSCVADRKYTVSCFPEKTKDWEMTDPKELEVTFDELTALICHCAWSPSELVPAEFVLVGDKYKLAPGKGRQKSAFLRSEICALDFDKNLTLEEAKAKFAGYKHIIATSRNHQKEKVRTDREGKITSVEPPCDRFRVVFFFERPIVATENPPKGQQADYDYERIMTYVMTLYSETDKSCKDGSRFFYPCKEIVSVNADGELYPVPHKDLISAVLDTSQKTVGRPPLTSAPKSGSRHEALLKNAVRWAKTLASGKDATGPDGLIITDEESLTEALLALNASWPDPKEEDEVMKLAAWAVKTNPIDEALIRGKKTPADTDVIQEYIKGKTRDEVIQLLTKDGWLDVYTFGQRYYRKRITKEVIQTFVRNLRDQWRQEKVAKFANIQYGNPWRYHKWLHPLLDGTAAEKDMWGACWLHTFANIKRKMLNRPEPEKKAYWHLFLIFYSREQGIGKSSLLNRFIDFFGTDFAGCVNGKMLDNEWSKIKLMTKYFSVFDELARLGNADRDALKELVTGNTVSVRTMHSEEDRTERNLATYFGTTNTQVVQRLGNDRRYIELPTTNTPWDINYVNTLDIADFWASIDPDTNYIEQYKTQLQQNAANTIQSSVVEWAINGFTYVGTRARSADLHQDYVKFCRAHRIEPLPNTGKGHANLFAKELNKHKELMPGFIGYTARCEYLFSQSDSILAEQETRQRAKEQQNPPPPAKERAVAEIDREAIEKEFSDIN